MVQGILLFSLPFACGICFFLHSATLQGSIALRHLSFRSNHQSAQTSATLAIVVPSFHFVHPSRVPLRPNFGFHPSTIHTSQNTGASFHPAPFTSFHSLATLAFPPQSSGMPCLLLTPVRLPVVFFLNKKAKQVRRFRKRPTHNAASRSSPSGFAIFFLFNSISFGIKNIAKTLTLPHKPPVYWLSFFFFIVFFFLLCQKNYFLNS